jgi:hypothetical protein
MLLAWLPEAEATTPIQSFSDANIPNQHQAFTT